MRGFAGLLADRTMAFGRQDRGLTREQVALADRTFAILRWQPLPHFAAGFGGTVAKAEADEPSGLPFQGDPDPNTIPSMTHKRPQFVEFEDRPLTEQLDARPNRCQNFLTIAAIVFRRKPVMREIAG
jgi:hypothetical protein